MNVKSGSLPVTFKASPNYGDRQTGPTDILLLHYTGMPDADQALDWLCNPQSGEKLRNERYLS